MPVKHGNDKRTKGQMQQDSGVQDAIAAGQFSQLDPQERRASMARARLRKEFGIETEGRGMPDTNLSLVSMDGKLKWKVGCRGCGTEITRVADGCTPPIGLCDACVSVDMQQESP